MVSTEETSKAHILLIDHQETHRSTYASFLRYQGYEVTTAPDGIDGLRLFRDGSYTLILCALDMPSMSGLEVAKKVKEFSTQRGKKTPVILFAGRSQQVVPEDLEDNGIDVVMIKPLRLDQLSELIERLVSKGR